MNDQRVEIGVISDTHGLMRPEALAALAGADHILHAGDIGSPEVIAALRTIAPVTVVRGNNDHGLWAKDIADTEIIELSDRWFYVIHDLAELDLEPRAAALSVVVSGHSHRPLIEHRHGVLYVNPGSAGPRRFTLPVSVARITVEPSAAPLATMITLAA